MKIRITPGAVLFLGVQLFTASPFFFAGVLAAALHECGHLLAARALHIPLRLLEIDIMGARIFPLHALPSYKAEGILAAAGPAASLLLALPLAYTNASFAVALRLSTLSFALFNLLPIEGFDGGRVLGALLGAKFGQKTAQQVLFFTSYLSLLFLFCLSSCLLLRYGENATLAVLSASLFAHLFLSVDRSGRRSVSNPNKKREFERF